MLRVAVGGLSHETNQYVVAPTTKKDFTVARGEQVLAFAGTRTYLGGMLDAARQLGVEAVGTLHALAMPSGVIDAATYQELKQALLDSLEAVTPVDAVVLDLHGAAVAEGVDDVEGDVCEAVRALVGPDVAVVVTHDLHGHITDREAAAVDAMFAVHHYPHDDMYERGWEALEAVPPIVNGTWRPVIHIERLPMLLPTTTTYQGVGADILEMCQRLEKEPGVLDVTFMHGFPYTDNRHVGAHVVVITDNDEKRARSVGKRAAADIWARRAEVLVDLPQPKDAIDQALAVAGQPVIINETSDNPGGGAPGDGTFLLRALIEAQPESAVFCGLCDPISVQSAITAGVGATIELSLGARTDELHGEPLRCQAYVKAITDGTVTLEAPMGRGWQVSVGPTALLLIDGIEVILYSKSQQTIDRTPLLLHGIDVNQRKIVALKSSQHFRSGFQELAAAIVTTDPPGLTTMQVGQLPRQLTPRPIFPLDADASYG